MSFNCNTSHEDGIPIISLEGKLIDTESCDVLKKAAQIAMQNNSYLVINMTKLEFLNSSGLNALIGILTRCRNAGGEMAIATISEKVRELFIMTKLINVFNVHNNVSEALISLKEAQTENE